MLSDTLAVGTKQLRKLDLWGGEGMREHKSSSFATKCVIMPSRDPPGTKVGWLPGQTHKQTHGTALHIAAIKVIFQFTCWPKEKSTATKSLIFQVKQVCQNKFNLGLKHVFLISNHL